MAYVSHEELKYLLRGIITKFETRMQQMQEHNQRELNEFKAGVVLQIRKWHAESIHETKKEMKDELASFVNSENIKKNSMLLEKMKDELERELKHRLDMELSAKIEHKTLQMTLALQSQLQSKLSHDIEMLRTELYAFTGGAGDAFAFTGGDELF